MSYILHLLSSCVIEWDYSLFTSVSVLGVCFHCIFSIVNIVALWP